MNSFKVFWIVSLLVLNSFLAVADDAITNITSPIISYQYPDDLGSEVVTNGGAISQIVSYQYYEWPGKGILNLQYSPTVSYYYPLLDAPTLNIISTTQTPTTAETTPALLFNTPSHLQVFANGAFTDNPPFPLDTNAVTIILTHGWVPTFLGSGLFPDSGPDGWPTKIATELQALGIGANIVAWDWTNAATSSVFDPEQAGSLSPTNGEQLGRALLAALGPNYSKKIQFIGHSFGTLVNSYAANYLQGATFATTDPVSSTPWPASNMLMTLFDEAEIGADKSFNFYSFNGIENLDELAFALASGNGEYLDSAPAYYHPLPKHYAWAENYVSAFGLLHTNAVNVILTNGLPSTAPGFLNLFSQYGNFHFYPVSWYEETIQNDNSAMGFIWPFLWLQDDSIFAQAPAEDSIYAQAFNYSEWDLTVTNWDFGTNWLAARFKQIRGGFGNSLVQLSENSILANGAVTGFGIGDLNSVEWLISLYTSSGGSGSPQLRTQPSGSLQAGNADDIPAYAWMQLVIPRNAVSMSFNYSIEGNWQDDSLAAALNGTNILLLPGSEIEINTVFNSGAFDVSTYAGQTNEFFIGIVGGTSTNAELTVENLSFTLFSEPTLSAQISNGQLILSWPLSDEAFSLQTTTNFSEANAWVTLTNVPSIANLENVITNTLNGGYQFYRLTH